MICQQVETVTINKDIILLKSVSIFMRENKNLDGSDRINGPIDVI